MPALRHHRLLNKVEDRLSSSQSLSADADWDPSRPLERLDYTARTDARPQSVTGGWLRGQGCHVCRPTSSLKPAPSCLDSLDNHVWNMHLFCCCTFSYIKNDLAEEPQNEADRRLWWRVQWCQIQFLNVWINWFSWSVNSNRGQNFSGRMIPDLDFYFLVFEIDGKSAKAIILWMCNV